jgi:hypothetical protein
MTSRLKEERESCKKKKRKERQAVGCQGFNDIKTTIFLLMKGV